MLSDILRTKERNPDYVVKVVCLLTAIAVLVAEAIRILGE